MSESANKRDDRAAHTPIARQPAAPRQRRRRPPRPKPKQPPAPPILPERTPAPERLVVGRIAAAHGLHGDLRMALLTNHPEQLTELQQVYVGDEAEPRRLRRVQLQRDGALVRIQGLDNPNEIAARRGQLVRIALADAPPLPEGEYYPYQLIGLDVFDLEGQFLGRLAEILITGANDVYLVRSPQGELLLPAIEEVVREVDPVGGKMIVKPQEYY